MHASLSRHEFSHITRAERAIIQRLLAQKCSQSMIARVLGKHRSTVSREIRRNKNSSGWYIEVQAENLSARRRLASKAAVRLIENDPVLLMYLERMLTFGLSPEQIAGFMARQRHEKSLSSLNKLKFEK